MIVQEYTSKKTSIKHIPRLIKWLDRNNIFKDNQIVLDFGCGKYDLAKEYVLSRYNLKYLMFDKYNRSEDCNDLTIEFVIKNSADIIICSNVLNVIKEKEIRFSVIKAMSLMLKENGIIYFTTYNCGHKSDYIENDKYVGQKTCNGWQNCQSTEYYLDDIKKIFKNVSIVDNIIIAKEII